jgi:hypothetical protein
MKTSDPDDIVRDKGSGAYRGAFDEAWSHVEEPPPSGNGAGEVPPQGEAEPPRRRRFPLERFNEIRASTAPPYLVKGIIPRTGIVVIWGEPKCGKTFKTHDVVMHVAIGRDYRGLRVKQGTVVYLAAEGAAGIRARTEAWRQKHLSENPDRDVPFFLIDAQVDLARDAADLIAAIRAELADTVPAVVVIDTLLTQQHWVG